MGENDASIFPFLQKTKRCLNSPFILLLEKFSPFILSYAAASKMPSLSSELPCPALVSCASLGRSLCRLPDTTGHLTACILSSDS